MKNGPGELKLMSSFFSKYIFVQKWHLFYNSRVRGSKQYVVEITVISLKSTERTQDNGASNTNGPVWSLLNSICFCHCLQWAWNQKCISFAISPHFKTWYFVVKYIIIKKNLEHYPLSFFHSSVPKLTQTEKGICGSYCLCALWMQGLYCCTSFGFRCWHGQLILDMSTKWVVIHGEFSQEFSGARLEWFHWERRLISELETAQTAHHIELAVKIHV